MLVLTAVLYCVLKTLNASNIRFPRTRSLNGKERTIRPSTRICLSTSRLPTGRKGTRVHPPDPFSVAYAKFTPGNCPPLVLPTKFTVGDTGCAEARVVIVESSH